MEKPTRWRESGATSVTAAAAPFGLRPALYQWPTPGQNHDGDQGHDGKIGDARLTMRHHDEGCQQRSERRAEITAELEQGLREAVPAARSHAGDARRLGVEDR